jgi:hypothetical protein
MDDATFFLRVSNFGMAPSEDLDSGADAEDLQ